MDVGNGPFSLDIGVIHSDTSKDGICLFELFGNISFALVVIP